MRNPVRLTLAAGLAVALALNAASLVAQEQREIFSGMVARMSGPGVGPSTGQLQITIEKWTTPEERQALATTLVEAGQKGLLGALEKADEKGFARFPGTLGWPIGYAWQFQDQGQRVIRLITDRPILFVEARGQTRTMDYPFGIVEMRLDAQGKGEGVVYSAASLKVNKDGVLEVESYGTGPQRFLSITTQKK